MPKYVYAFAEGNKDLKDLLGGKGANLAEMTKMGLPVPPGFTISTEACRAYLEKGAEPEELAEQVTAHLHSLEEERGRTLGQADGPLLVSVRSGAAVSMPGMMETVLNVGLNDEAAEGLGARTSNPRFALDSYRRFVQMYGSVVFEVPKKPFEQILEEHKQRCRIERDIDLPVQEMQAIVRRFKEHVRQESGRE